MFEPIVCRKEPRSVASDASKTKPVFWTDSMIGL